MDNYLMKGLISSLYYYYYCMKPGCRLTSVPSWNRNVITTQSCTGSKTISNIPLNNIPPDNIPWTKISRSGCMSGGYCPWDIVLIPLQCTVVVGIRSVPASNFRRRVESHRNHEWVLWCHPLQTFVIRYNTFSGEWAICEYKISDINYHKLS